MLFKLNLIYLQDAWYKLIAGAKIHEKYKRKRKKGGIWYNVLKFAPYKNVLQIKCILMILFFFIPMVHIYLLYS